MIIPISCKEVINRELLNECCEPNLEDLSPRQQVVYLSRHCQYLLDTILSLIHIVRNLEQESEYPADKPSHYTAVNHSSS